MNEILTYVKTIKPSQNTAFMITPVLKKTLTFKLKQALSTEKVINPKHRQDFFKSIEDYNVDFCGLFSVS